MAGINLAAPDFEPTDEQLQELSKRAFAHVGRQHAESMAKLRAAIARLGEEARRRLASVPRA